MKYFLIYLSVSALVLTYCNSEVDSLTDLVNDEQTTVNENLQNVKEEALVNNYKGKGYTIDIPENWMSKDLSENQVLFTGPKVGNANVGFYITRLPKEDKSYLIAADKTKKQQSEYEHYTVLEEKDISQPGFNAFMRRAQWFEQDIDMELFVREIFTESEEYVYILSTSIPNTPDINELDKAVVAMMNTFRFQ